MQIFTDIKKANFNKNTVVALGNFDGVHIGHVEILKTAVEQAEKIDGISVCYTFANHPRSLFCDKDGKEIGYITDEDDKLSLIEKTGIDVVCSVDFNSKLMQMLPEKFVSDILANQLNAAGVSCGFNYRFGAKAAGDTDLLRILGDKYNIKTHIHDAVSIDGKTVSSTLIRNLIESGEMEQTAKCLGRRFSVKGVVIKGSELGEKIGFPTANISLDEHRIAPPNGVYETYTLLEGCRLPSVTNIGVKPTVGTFGRAIETHILSECDKFYGKNIIIEFLKWERPEIKFSGIDELATQIAKDKDIAIEYHATSSACI